MIDAAVCAGLCRDAYALPPDIAAGAARAIVRDVGDHRVIAFQGTHDAHQVVADLDVGPLRIPVIGAVHRGIWEAMLGIAVRADVAAAGRPLIIIGHSLGGALAIALAVHRTRLGKPPGAVVTFGAPRIGIGPGCGAVLDATDVHCRLYRHGADVVPDLPPAVPLWEDWRHPAPLIQVGVPDDPVEDHAIARYCAALGAPVTGS
ncbi:MAG: lipase family protein [Magnetospirillum sp.]|nr:lipase family protein [Magnetospirillum sp.]